MTTLAVAVASGVLMVVPVEHHIDLSGWAGGGQVEFDMRLTFKDGTVFERTLELQPGSDAESARDFLWSILKSAGYRGHTVGKGIIVLEGAKQGPIRSVEFKSKVWAPDVRRVPVVPQKK